MPQIGGREVTINQLGILGGGLLAFLGSFLPWLTVHASFTSAHSSLSGWQSGGLAAFPLALLLMITVQTALKTFGTGRVQSLGTGDPTLTAVAFGGLATLLIIIRWATLSHVVTDQARDAGFKTSSGAGVFLGFFGALILTGFAVHGLVTARSASASGAPAPWPSAPQAWPQNPPAPQPWPQQPAAPQTPSPWQQQPSPAPQQGWQGWQQPQAPEAPAPQYPQTGPAYQPPPSWPQS